MILRGTWMVFLFRTIGVKTVARTILVLAYGNVVIMLVLVLVAVMVEMVFR